MGQTDPAIIRLIHNIHRQSLVDEKPAIIGPIKSPIFESKSITALPLYSKFGYKSLYIPPVTVWGAEAPHPTRNLKKSKAGQFGASAQAIVKSVKKAKDEMKQAFLPYDSLRGPKTRGPNTYPIRETATGSAACWFLVTLKALFRLSMAPLGKLELRVVLKFSRRPMTTANNFFRYLLY